MKFKVKEKIYLGVAEEIRNQITHALKTLNLPVVDFDLDHPTEMEHGDYATNVALKLKTQNSLNQSPKEIAAAISKAIEQQIPHIKYLNKVQVADPGFINFWLSDEFLVEEIKQVMKEGEVFGTTELLKGKKLMVEFAHPNTHKQFHIGHMRNICLGESLSRIFEANGAKVIRTNYQGDVGLHVAKAIWGAKKLGLPSDSTPLSQRVEFLGQAYVEGNKAYETNNQAKQKIQALNAAIYTGEKDIKPIWAKTRQWSLEYFDWIYQRVYTKFDRLYFESEVAEPGKQTSQEALKQGILSKSQGAVVFLGEKYGVDTRVFLTKEGLPTYEGKELGLAALEFSEFGQIDKCIHVVGPEQTSFFATTFKVEELLDAQKYQGKQEHFAYGYVKLKAGKMSSREGNIVTGEWLLNEAKKMINQILAKRTYSPSEQATISEPVSVGAIKFSMLKVSPVKDIAFDFAESINFEGNSGPYLQYTYARAQSVLKKGKVNPKKISQIISESSNNEYISNPEEKLILRFLYQFPEVVLESGQEYAPHVICTYLFSLAQAFNAFYNKHSILGNKQQEIVNHKTKEFRLALTAATAQVLENGLQLLGIKAPEKM